MVGIGALADTIMVIVTGMDMVITMGIMPDSGRVIIMAINRRGQQHILIMYMPAGIMGLNPRVQIRGERPVLQGIPSVQRTR